eukprot:CAMPEP_0119006644 /NCGR_PEP_ID=MMETSP1176-20130426/2438_1 /TAXON_ID=265551 /ORGANISM="Synedropsis recta cf, Strain CCMP1620" /LENGTH=233 /DNA_ID=CAMNT_0006958595 /DNA_START=44 /DNA_END=745 /DNA_ORIENTATION=-
MSNSQEEPLKRMSKLVNSLMTKPDAGPFREPVDWRELELFDYPKLIKKMMDLGTVKRKLERKQYATAHECAQDIRLIWQNCLTYNADGSDFWLLAKSFSRRFEDRFKKIKGEYDVGEDIVTAGKADSKAASGGATAITLDSKAQLASKIFLLSGMELSHVVTTIENRCPKALEQVGDSTHIEINVDALDPRIFMDVEKYVKDKVTSRHSNTDQVPEDVNKGGSSGSSSKKKKK